MSFSINRVTLVGNITQVPELKYTQNGKPVLNFSMATNYSKKQGDDFVDVSTFHKIVVWGNIASWLANNIFKGEKVYVDGRIDNRSWDKPDGTKGYISEIVADSVIPMKGKNNGGSNTASNQNNAGQENQTKNQDTAGEYTQTDEINMDDFDFDLDTLNSPLVGTETPQETQEEPKKATDRKKTKK